MNALSKETREKDEKCLKEKKCSSSLNLLFDEDGYYIGSQSEYNENETDIRTGEPFYGMRFD